MAKRPFRNRLNDLTTKEWIKFQKSWFIHNPPPRKKGVLRHPAKFPETLVQEFIEFFTKRGETVLDPMAGTGSTLVAALRAGRNSYGIELNPQYAAIASQVLAEEAAQLAEPAGLRAQIITGDASRFAEQVAAHQLPSIDYVITSPPYWDMLRAKGFETQQKRRALENLDVCYSENPNDLGNIPDYEDFLQQLVAIYQGLKFLEPEDYPGYDPNAAPEGEGEGTAPAEGEGVAPAEGQGTTPIDGEGDAPTGAAAPNPSLPAGR